MNFREKHGPVGLVAGASEGLGEAFARALAAGGLDLTLVARRKEPLKRVSEEITNVFGVKVRTIVCDLTADHATEEIRLALPGTRINCLVYKAASSQIGHFERHPLPEHLQVVSINIVTPVRMLHEFGSAMLTDERGAILIMSSLAGFQGSGFLATYAASEAFSKVMAESLWYEWKDKGVDVFACCACATATPGYLKSRPKPIGWLVPRPEKPEAVVEESLNRIGRSPSFVSGQGNRIATYFMQQLLPRKRGCSYHGSDNEEDVRHYGLAAFSQPVQFRPG